MSRRKKNMGCLEAMVMIPFLPVSMFIHYVTHYNPTPIVGGKRGRKKKKWF